MEDVEVRKLLAKESLEQAKAEFEDDDLDWMITLSRDQFGKIGNKVSNLVMILEHDEAFKNIAFNVLASTAEVTGLVPWNKSRRH